MAYDLDRFIEILESENRFEALQYVLGVIETEAVPFYEIYEKLLAPSLNEMQASGNEDDDIWHEHIRTAIILTIVENMYPYVIRSQNGTPGEGKSVVVFCPPDEYHSVGARMVKDIFTYLGYEAIFVGGNTPLRVLDAALTSREIDYLAISVSNPYHLISTRNMIEAIRKAHPEVKIILGGHAVKRFGERAKRLQADYIMTSFDELQALEGGSYETSL